MRSLLAVALLAATAVVLLLPGPATHGSIPAIHPLVAPHAPSVPAPTTNTSVLDLRMWLNASLNLSNVSGIPGSSSSWSFTWGGLPGNCTTANVSNYTCRPTTTGAYNVVVTVKAPSMTSGVISSPVTITVNSDPVVSSITVSASNVTVNQQLTFTTTASGGSAPLAYFYSGLPKGCSGNTSTIQCQPTTAQTYHVVVFVRDAVSMSSPGKSVNVTVAAATAGAHGPTAAQWGIIAAILVVGFALAALLWMRARREERATYSATPRAPPPGASASSVPPGVIEPPASGPPPSPPPPTS